MPRGGKRPGAGRPKKEQTKRVSVPLSLLDKIKLIIKNWKENDAKKTTKKPHRPF